jgi:hypothetical protein
VYPGIYARIKGFYRYWFVWSPSDRREYRQAYRLYCRKKREVALKVVLDRQQEQRDVIRFREAQQAAKEARCREAHAKAMAEECNTPGCYRLHH